MLLTMLAACTPASSDKEAIDKAVSATLAAEQSETVAPTARPTAQPVTSLADALRGDPNTGTELVDTPPERRYVGCDGLMELIPTIGTDGVAQAQLMMLAVSGNADICNQAIESIVGRSGGAIATPEPTPTPIPVPVNTNPTVPSGSTPSVTPTETAVPSPTATPAAVPQFSVAGNDADFDPTLMRVFEDDFQAGAKLLENGELAILYPDGSTKVFDAHIQSSTPDGELLLLDSELEYFAYTSATEDGCFLHLWLEDEQSLHCIPSSSQIIDADVSLPVTIENADHIFKIDDSHFGLHVQLKIRESLFFKSGEGQLSFVQPETVVVYSVNNETINFPLRGYAFTSDGRTISNPSPKFDPLVLATKPTEQGIRAYRLSADKRSIWVFHPAGAGRSVSDWVRYSLFDGIRYAAYVPVENRGRTSEGESTDPPESFIATRTGNPMLFGDGVPNFFSLDVLDSTTVAPCAFSAKPLKLVIDFCHLRQDNNASIQPLSLSSDGRYLVTRLISITVPSLVGVTRETCSVIPSEFDDQWSCLSLFGGSVDSQSGVTTSAPYQAYGDVVAPTQSNTDLIIDLLTGEMSALTLWSLGWDGKPVISPDDAIVNSPLFGENGCTISSGLDAHKQVKLWVWHNPDPPRSQADGVNVSVANPLNRDCWR